MVGMNHGQAPRQQGNVLAVVTERNLNEMMVFIIPGTYLLSTFGIPQTLKLWWPVEFCVVCCSGV